MDGRREDQNDPRDVEMPVVARRRGVARGVLASCAALVSELGAGGET